MRIVEEYNLGAWSLRLFLRAGRVREGRDAVFVGPFERRHVK